jgi:SAM-dependent methyltransferase
MDDREARCVGSDGAWDPLQAFYDLHPYPPPVDDLDSYRRRWQDEGRRRADYHLLWPEAAYRTDLAVLVAGCGTSQAAKYALRRPACQVIGIDLSATSVRHTEALSRRHGLSNLEVHQLPVERAGELGRRFDQIICTGVLHHLPEPDAGLRALREVLAPEGAIHLMVYAPYGRAGIYMLQEYCRRLGIGHSEAEIRDLAATLTALPHQHPLARLLGESPDFQRADALADALLNPRDRAYTVPQLLDLVERCGLVFGRWVRRAPYLPQCGALARTPHTSRLAQLPKAEQYAAVELFRGTLLRHSLILYRDDRPGEAQPIRFDDGCWRGYVPLRLPEATGVRKRLPAGAAAVLINQGHTCPDLYLPIDQEEMQLLDAIDGKRTIADIARRARLPEQPGERARGFFERLWWYDQVVFDASNRLAMGV